MIMGTTASLFIDIVPLLRLLSLIFFSGLRYRPRENFKKSIVKAKCNNDVCIVFVQLHSLVITLSYLLICSSARNKRV